MTKTHRTLDITDLSKEELQATIEAILSGEKTFEEAVQENPGPFITITEI